MGLSEQTARAMALAWDRFAAFAVSGYDARGVEDLDAEIVRAFVHARHEGGATPSTAAMHWRRSAVRLLFRIWRDLGLTEGDPTLDLRLPRRSSLATRPLTDDEVAMCRWASLATATETRLPAVWALAEAGATSGEIPFVRCVDVDLRGRHRLAAAVRRPMRGSRRSPIGDCAQVRRRIEVLGGDPFAHLVYEGSGRPESAQASVSGAIGDVLRRAGLGDEPDVRPRSVTAWVGRAVFDETGRIEAVARRLGMRSLDRAAALIGWQWRTP